ncbi:hypothetical protein FFWV33_09325 [Flavobacterium faecale]|uniref:4'-phosphopantetheinyl transferase domain-containing protein n=1 Tax=Flavobacterium faecale TaxID=1355330 RepID=A0A2S1LD94_9FLAO|nr:4'-phosphopantetheinyl transferase superfamily protein [Flavobacterium faecale]AWG21725.1 hypothetical protein FFWV33_09325 [Flavobacterium faecale]
MIGNDVVDLVLAKTESNWRRKGYLDKLYTTWEQTIIKKSVHPDEMVWVLWSIKESVYKAYQRIEYNEGFYPIKIEVQSLENDGDGYNSTTALFGILFYGQTTIKDGIVHTVVVQYKSDLEKIKRLPVTNYKKNKKGLPIHVHTGAPVSVSHHGRSTIVVGLDYNNL